MKGLTKQEAEIIDQALLYASVTLADKAQEKPKEGEKPLITEAVAAEQIARLYELSLKVHTLVSEDHKIGFVK